MTQSRGNENFICGPLVPEEVRQSISWQHVSYDKFIYTANALRSLAHMLKFNVRPLYLECGSNLDETGKELSRRLIVAAYGTVAPPDEIPERRKFFMRLVGRDPDKLKYPLSFPTQFEASRGEAAVKWAVSAPEGKPVVEAAEALLDFAGPDAEHIVDLLKRESPKFAKGEILETIQASIVRPSGYIQKLLLVARAAAQHNTYFLSWWD